jgi:hypothetical protein
MVNARKALHPPRVVLEHGSNPCLLQHDLGDPDAISVRIATPGKIAAMRFIPTTKGAAEVR